MISRVIFPARLSAAFRKSAVAVYPNEFFQTLWGWVRGDTITIEALRDSVHRATSDEVNTTIADQLHPLPTTQLHYLGTIHSHPDPTDTSPSEADWDDGFSTGETVFFVMAVWKSESGRFRTAIRAWEPRPPIAIVHPRIRSPRKRRDLGVTETVPFNQTDFDKAKSALDTPALNTVQSEPPIFP